MSELILDRRWRLRETPAFLEPVGERDRSVGRLFVFVPLGLILAVLATALVVVAVMGAGAAVLARQGHSLPDALNMLAHGDRPGRTLAGYTYEFATAGLSLFASAVVLLSLAAKLYRRPMRSFVTAAPRFRWKLALLGFGVALPIILIALFAEQAWTSERLHPPILSGAGAGDVAIYVLAATVFLFLAALAEEMIFRGWLLQQTGAFTRSIPILLAVNGILFSLAHGDLDPGAFLVRAGMGATWAWIALRLGGLEFGAGAHLANNLLVSLLVQPLTLTAPTHQQADLRSGLVQLAILGASVAAVELLVRRGKLEHSFTSR